MGGFARRGKQLHKKNERRCFIGRHIWSFCARVGPFGVRRSGLDLLLPLLFIKGSRLRGGSTSTGCSPLSLSRPPPPTLSFFLSRWAGFAIKPAPGESNASARCFLPLPGKAKKKKKTMSGDAGYLTGRKPMNYERRSRQGLCDIGVGREEA